MRLILHICYFTAAGVYLGPRWNHHHFPFPPHGNLLLTIWQGMLQPLPLPLSFTVSSSHFWQQLFMRQVGRESSSNKLVQPCFSQITLCFSDRVLIWLNSQRFDCSSQIYDLWISSTSIFTRWLFCLLTLLFLFIMHQGCLATPASCSVIDSLRDLYITDRQLTRAGPWCVPCFWLRICVLNSHGPPAGWHKADGSLRAAFLISSAPGRPCMLLFLFLSILQWRGGLKREKQEEPASERWRASE